MAYAAITDTLKNDVTSKIRSLKVAEVNTMPAPDTVMTKINENTELFEHAVSLLWANTEPDLRPRLEKYNATAAIRFKFHVPAEYSKDGSTTREVQVRFPCVKRVPCTVATTTGYGAQTEGVFEIDFAASPLFTEYAEVFKNYVECVNRWDEVANQVTNFLDSCKSVNEALKLWPDVARYLPKASIAKVNEKSVKQTRDASTALAALQAINMDQVNTSTVLARMAGATV